jgi:PTS system D-glucosamine-specific IIC component
MNLKTPGREADTEETKLYTRADYEKKKNAGSDEKGAAADGLSADITKGLGGKANISDVDCCATRLRITVFDSDKVKDDILKATGAAGVIHKGTGIQVIYGPRVTVIKSNLEDYLAAGGTAAEDAALESVNTVMKEDIKLDKHNSAEKQEAVPGQETIIHSPISGRVIELSEVGDGVFSEEMLGKGFAVQPSEGKIVAPFDCRVETVFDTKHAIGLKSGNVELLIHIGIDTVQLNGKGYDIRIHEGDVLKKGDLIGYFDIKVITEAGYQVVTPVIITNTDEFKDFEILKRNLVKAEDIIMSVK